MCSAVRNNRTGINNSFYEIYRHLDCLHIHENYIIIKYKTRDKY